MKFEELRFVCEEAAKDLLKKHGRPIEPTIVLPGPDRTRLMKLSGFPEDDETRHALVARFAQDQVVEGAVPCWGFVVEGDVNGQDALLLVYGARKHAPEITAAPLSDDELGEFLEGEELDPTAMPFLHPLQHAVDAMPAVEDDTPGPGMHGMGPAGQGLPLIN